MAQRPMVIMPQKVYSLYHNIEDFTFSMPGGWDDYTISVFLEACHKYVEDLRNYGGDFMRQWSRIVGYGLAMTSNLNCFNITVTMELAKVLKAYLLKNENTEQYVTNEAFKNLLDDTKDLLAYFPNANESQIPAANHSKKCNCLPSDNSKPMSIIHVIKQVSKQYRHLFGAKGIPASILWTEMSQKVSDKTGVKVDVKQFLEPVKIEIAIKVRKETDSDMKTKKFLALAKDYLAYFDYIPPRSIKKSDFLPPELLNVIDDDDYDLCKNDEAESNEEGDHVPCSDSEDFMDVDYVGAYCEVPYSEESKSNQGNNSPKGDSNGRAIPRDRNNEGNLADEESMCSFIDFNARDIYENVGVEKCETDVVSLSNGNQHSDVENTSRVIKKSYNCFGQTFHIDPTKRSDLLRNRFDADGFPIYPEDYGLSMENCLFVRSPIGQNSYCPSPLLKKYPTTKSDYPCKKLVDSVPSDKNKSDLSKEMTNTEESNFTHNKTESDICSALNSMQLINSDAISVNEHERCKIDYSGWNNNIGARDEMERMTENFTLHNLSYEQTDNRACNNPLEKTNSDQLTVTTSSNTVQSSNVVCNIYDGTKFSENLLREDVYDLNGSVTDDVFNSGSDKIPDSLESLIAASRNSSPLTVPESIQNLMIEDINSNEICDDGLFKRTISETCNSIGERQENNPLKEDCRFAENSNESAAEEFENNSNSKTESTNRCHITVYNSCLRKRAKSADSVLYERTIDLDSERSSKRCLAFLNELREMLLDKKNGDVNMNSDKASESGEPCEDVSKSKELEAVNEETASQKDKMSGPVQLASMHQLNATNDISNERLSNGFTDTTNNCSLFRQGNSESNKLNLLCSEGADAYVMKPLEQNPSVHDGRNIPTTCKQNVYQLLRKRRLKERMMYIPTPWLKRKRLLYKNKIKLFKRLRSLRKRYNDLVHPSTMELAKLKKLSNLDKGKPVEASDSENNQKSGQEVEANNEVNSFTAESVLSDASRDTTSSHKRVYQEDGSSSDDSDTPFYGFTTCSPTRRFKKRRNKLINFSRSDNVGAVIVDDQVVILKKAVVLVKDFIQDVTRSMETDPKRHVCFCNCSKLKEQVTNNENQSDFEENNRPTLNNSENSSRTLNDEGVHENSTQNEGNYLNQTDMYTSSNSVIEGRANHGHHKRNTLKASSKENLPDKRMPSFGRIDEAADLLQDYSKKEVSPSKALRELMEAEQVVEMGFDSVFDSVTEFLYRAKRKPCSWYNKFITEYRNHLTWKTQIKWKMEKEVQGVEKNKALIMDKILKVLPKINID